MNNDDLPRMTIANCQTDFSTAYKTLRLRLSPSRSKCQPYFEISFVHT